MLTLCSGESEEAEREATTLNADLAGDNWLDKMEINALVNKDAFCYSKDCPLHKAGPESGEGETLDLGSLMGKWKDRMASFTLYSENKGKKEIVIDSNQDIWECLW